MGVTAITKIDNQSGSTIIVLDKENSGVSGHNVPISPGDNLSVYMYIPWAPNPGEFPGHHLEICYDGVGRFFIWQAYIQNHGDFVRFSDDGAWHSPGDKMPGLADVDGNRTLVVFDDGIQLFEPNRWGITAFVRIDNNSSELVKVLDMENLGAPGSGSTLNSGESLDVDMYVPWAPEERDFSWPSSPHHLEVEVGGTKKWFIWQAKRADGDFVRFSADGSWHDPGDHVRGQAQVRGDRALVIHDGFFEVVPSARKPPPPPEAGKDRVVLARPDNSTFTYKGRSFNPDRPARIVTVKNIAKDVNDTINIQLKVSHEDATGASFGPIDIQPNEGVAFNNLAVDGPWTAEAVFINNVFLRDHIEIEVAWKLDHEAGTDNRVKCIVRDNSDPDNRIQAIGGERPDGTRWKHLIKDAITRIEDGQRFYVEEPAGGRRVPVVVAIRNDGTKYLKTIADGVRPNNLLSLPNCP